MSNQVPFGKAVTVLSGYDKTNLDERVLLSPCPLVLKGFCQEWPLVKTAAESDSAVLDYIGGHYARVPVTTCILPAAENGRIFYNKDMSGFNFSANLESFTTFTKLLLNEKSSTSPRGVYMPSTDVIKWFPTLDKDNNAGIDTLNAIKLIWIGNKTKIAAHYDFTSNLACCVAGRRRFTVFPPEQVVNLYPGPLEFAPGGQEISLVDFSNPDLTRFPRFAAAKEAAQVAEVEAGDALFLPGMWWHHVEGLDAVNILYTHWWRESPSHFGRPSDCLLHAIMNIRGLSPHQRRAWSALFDYYVFNYDIEDLNNMGRRAKGLFNVPMSPEQAQSIRQLLIKQLDK